ncbi:hypothetical protein G6F37_006167 [Rhizopus arrhizus]|nr:hypothetical protein G6F38_006219 [Rhizopus arrhizus]KAG1158039.1 hypothetical protein G6F37_006167 [Rhizopus arrhizus]
MKFITIASSALLALALGTEMASAAECSKLYGQCGGKNWNGPTCCESGSTCKVSNDYYSQCLSSGSSDHKPSKSGHKKTTTAAHKKTTTAPAKKTSSSSSGKYSVVSGGASGTAATTQYWDCCKASCSWPGRAKVSSPVKSCKKDGVTVLSDSNVLSVCNGGSSYMCNDNQPWAVNDNLAYGFAAAVMGGSDESRLCCSCYELTFTSTAVAGKKMVVQVTNTGVYPEANHFDLQSPGGGVGIFNGCSNQWGAPKDGWGKRYGGISSASECSSLPPQLQAGCHWRFNWFKNADNPSVTYKEVTCPKEITAKTGCSRQ